MINCYYSIILYIEKYPSNINCCEIMNMADEIGSLLGCKYDWLGYTLLHPDHDYKDLGKRLKNNKKNRELFARMSIPLKYHGKKEEIPAAPFISFELSSKDEFELPAYEIELSYPVCDSHYLRIEIDIKENLLNKALTLLEFQTLQRIISSNGYLINSAFVHYYFGSDRRGILNGFECGIITINDWRIIAHSINFREKWKNKMMDIFYMNSIKKEAISSCALKKIKIIVGSENVIEDDGKIMFKLPQSAGAYRLNRIISTRSRNKIKKILQEENVCNKDATITASILRL